MSRTDQRRRLDVALALALFAFGLALCLHYGRRGFMPLDQSIVWDAGWRVLDGQVPFRDFVTTTSLVPGTLQAGVFGLMGVSWLAYCLHAAVFNGLFAIVTFALLRSQGLHPAAAAAFGGAAAVFFYPPFGVPYGDQHSFFFGLLALLLCALALRAEAAPAGGASRLWALVPAALLLGYLSKPIPVAFLLPALAVAALWPGERWTRRVGLLGLGAALSVALVAAVSRRPAPTSPWPGTTSSGFPSSWAGTGAGVRALSETGSGPCFTSEAGPGSCSPWRRSARPSWPSPDSRSWPASAGSRTGRASVVSASLSSSAVCCGRAPRLFVGVTRNQARNGHALLPVILGLQAAALARLVPAAAALDHRAGPLAPPRGAPWGWRGWWRWRSTTRSASTPR